MRRHSFALFVCSLFLTFASAQRVHPSDRIGAVPDDTRTVRLTGNRHPLARVEYEAGPVEPGFRMDKMILVLDSSDEQKQALDQLAAAQQDSASPDYQKWLTPEKFAEQFGVSHNDVRQITAWLETHGFQIDEVPPGRRTIVFSGTASAVEEAFHTKIKQYRVNGELHHANATDPEIPEALAAVVKGTSTLHDFGRRSMRVEKQAVPEFGSGSGAYLGPADFATIYNLLPLHSSGTDGTGQSIAIVGRTNLNLSDVTQFRSYFGLPLNNPSIILNGTNPGINSDVDEALLDVEWSGAVAPKAAVKFVVSASTASTDGIDLSAQYIVANNLAPAMSTSYGSCEAAMGVTELAFYSNLWQQASVQGISATISSGDSGAAGCDSGSAASAQWGRRVNGLCSSIYSVCVGGTEFNDTSNYSAYWLSSVNATTKESAISYIPEMAWNQSGSVSGGSGLWATGGGGSAIYSKPAWQAGPGVPADGARDVPDVSMAAATHDGFLIFENGSMYAIGGTSASSPSFAGVMALVNQKNGRQGNPNPKLYALAALQSQGNAGRSYFHDVTSGSNSVPGAAGYNAATGYDLATGLGSVNADMLVNYWNDAVVVVPPSLSANMSAGSLTIRQGGSGVSTATISVGGGFSHAVTLAVSGAPEGVTATLTSANLAAPGSGTSVLTITAGSTAAAGMAKITVTGTGGSATSTATVSLTIVPAFSLAANAGSVAIQQGSSASFTVTSAIASGFSGGVALTVLSANGSALPAGFKAAFSPVTIPSPGSGASTLTITLGPSTAVGSYPLAVIGSSGSLTSRIPITVSVLTATSFALSATPSSVTVAPGGTGASAISLTPGSGFTGVVALSTGSLPVGITFQFSATSFGRTGGKIALTAKVAGSVAAGSYPITLIGTGGGVSPSPTVVLTIVVGGYSVKAGSATASVVRNGSVLVPITTSTTGGFVGDLTLSVSGLPAGVTAIFTPAMIGNVSAGSSSVRLTAAATAQTGTKVITIVATSSAGAVQTTDVSLTVH